MADEDSTLGDSTLDDSTIADTTQPNFLAGVTNALGLVAGLAAIGATASALSDIFSTTSAPSDFIVPDLANNGSPAIGFGNASGGLFGSPYMVNTVSPSVDDALGEANISPGTWNALDFMVNRALGMDWATKNADPGNPNILEAYRFAGRGFTQDGGTGQFTWAAAFATWILVKSGFNGLRTMSPRAFERYGNPVRFHQGPLTNVRKWDMFVFTSNVNIQHVGFVKSYDPRTQTIEIIGGDQADKVKVTRMPYSVTNPLFRVTHVRRNWEIPADADTSIIVQQTQPRRPITPTPTPSSDVAPTSPLSEITVQPLPPVGASAAEIAEFNRRYPPVPTSDPRAQFSPYTISPRRPTTEDITALATGAIERADQIPPAPTRPRTVR